MVDADVANGRGEMAGQIEQRLSFSTTVGSPRDALAQGEDAHELAVRGEGDGHHCLQHRHFPCDLARSGIRGLGVGFFDLDKPSLRHQPEGQAAVRGKTDRFDDQRGQPARGAHAVLPVLVFGEEDGAPGGPRQL